MRVLLIQMQIPQTGDTVWVAQGLDRDIVVQGSTRRAAVDSLEELIGAQIAFDKERGIEPLSQFGRAPSSEWDLWGEAEPSPV